ncbi:polyribonucleotide nucleotidyltransferase [Patescibacteria group bacterium]
MTQVQFVSSVCIRQIEVRRSLFMKTKEYRMDFHNRPLVAEFTDITEQANGSVILKYGDTTVLATAVMSERQRDGLDYFPLSVDYEEKFYAVGKILGGRFMKREGRPSEEAVLNGRMVDRTLRPLFDKRIRNDMQVVVSVLSVDDENDPDTLSVLAASIALATSDIPWAGPVGALRVGRIDGKFIINPTFEEKEKSDIDLVICGKDNKINMIEGEAKQVKEEEIIKAFELAIPELEKLIDFQNKIISEIGKEKVAREVKEIPDEMQALFAQTVKPKLEKFLATPSDKKEHYLGLGDLAKEWDTLVEEKMGEDIRSEANDIFEETIDETMHKNILEHDMRPDGRRLDEVRPLFAKAGLLNRAHGSGLFYRGLTHILSVLTLGSPSDTLIIEGMEVREKRSFMHHYNFPPFSVGETGRLGGPGRRDIGHGALARKALEQVIPDKEVFPYTIRLVSETMSSNGSSSMGSVCASTLALMDAGVPIKAPVSGIAMGLMMKNENEYKVLTDIQGPEDHHGDTDFKSAGTENGVTAIQMDVKVGGLTVKILSDIIHQSRKARMHILKTMLQELPEARKEMSPFAPCIITTQINPEKKGALIGPGGKTINNIIDLTNAQIDIEETGLVFITGADKESALKAKVMVEDTVYEPQVGEVFKGTVTRMFDFGVMVEIKPHMEGLVHVSELADHRVNKPTDVVKTGDSVTVKLVGIDEKGRMNLSIKQANSNHARTPDKQSGRPKQRGPEKRNPNRRY